MIVTSDQSGFVETAVCRYEATEAVGAPTTPAPRRVSPPVLAPSVLDALALIAAARSLGEPSARSSQRPSHWYEMTTPERVTSSSGISDQKPIVLKQSRSLRKAFSRAGKQPVRQVRDGLFLTQTNRSANRSAVRSAVRAGHRVEATHRQTGRAIGKGTEQVFVSPFRVITSVAVFEPLYVNTSCQEAVSAARPAMLTDTSIVRDTWPAIG